MRTAGVLFVAAFCASFGWTAEDAWQEHCIARAKLALSLTRRGETDDDSEALRKNTASCSLKFLRYSAVRELIPEKQHQTELFTQYEEFEFSNNAFEVNRFLCKLLEKDGSIAPTLMESVRLLSSQDDAVLKKAFANLKDAPTELITKFKELKEVDYKRAFAEQMKLLEWAEAQLVKEFETKQIVDNSLFGYNHTDWKLVHPSYDELSMWQSIEVLYGVLLLHRELGNKSLTLSNLTFHFDLDELWDEPQLKIAKEMKVLRGEFWTVRGNDFWKVLNPWLAKNHTYVYYHPAEKHFRIDYAAREKGLSTKDYRSTLKWGRNEGPNKIDPAKVVDNKDD